MWDEMRHSMFGKAAIEDLLDDRAAMPLREWETEYLYRLEPLPLYAMLCDVEAGQEEVATLREIYDRLFESQAGRDEGNQYDLAGLPPLPGVGETRPSGSSGRCPTKISRASIASVYSPLQ